MKCKTLQLLLFLLVFAVFHVRASATVIDSLDAVANWNSQTGDGSTVTVSTTTGHSNMALQLDYSLGSSAWVQAYKNYQYIDLSSEYAIRFRYRGTGTTEELVVKVKDADADTFQYSLGNVTNTADWTTATIKLSDFTCETTHSIGNQTMDWTQVKSMEFVINDKGDAGGSGTVEIDQIEKMKQGSAPILTLPLGNLQNFEANNGTVISTKTVFNSIQDFEASNGTSGAYFWSVWNSTPSFSAGTVHRGARALTMNANGTVGINPKSQLVSIASTVNATNADTFSAWVYDTQGANTCEMRLTDTNGGTKAVWSTNAAVQNEWTELTWPASSFTGVDLGNIHDVQFYEANNGIYYFDDIGFYRQEQKEDVSDYAWSVYLSTPSLETSTVYNGIRALKATGGGTVGINIVNYTSAGIDIFARKTFYVFVYDTVGNNSVELRLTDVNGGTKALWSSGTAVQNEWTFISWNLSDFSGTVDLSKIKNIQLYEYNTGTYYFDDVGVDGSSGEGIYTYLPDGFIDEMEVAADDSNWTGSGDNSTKADLHTVAGQTGNALQLDYNLNNGAWVLMSKKFSLSLQDGNQIKFWLKQTGDKNYVEIKLKDADGTVFYHKRTYDTFNNWIEIVIPYKNFIWFESGTDENLDFSDIAYIYFTVSKKDGDTGTILVDEFQYEQKQAINQNLGEDKVLQQVTVTNNPFSPNGEGSKNAVSINVTLTEAATIRLRVYDLAGDVLYEKEQDYIAGGQQLIWDGKNNDGEVQRSGLYIYQLKVTGNVSGKEETFKHIIGISK
ncbi:MAG: CIA30 family protein [bacterium]|nr:CIA30 family protein [bacterium]